MRDVTQRQVQKGRTLGELQNVEEVTQISSGLPPGPRWPSAAQAVAQWNRPLTFLERCRARYGKRFTMRSPLLPPFVVMSDPEDIKGVFTAPADALHPGEGAKILEPVVGSNSVILLDEAPHMEQRRLMLPAFHGEKMERLSGLMAEVVEREIACWPRGTELALQPRMQHLTLEIILRAVFGLDPGERLDALRDRLSELLTFGDRPVSLLPIPIDSNAGRMLGRLGPFKRFLNLQAEIDERIFELIDERRADIAAGNTRDDVLSMLLEARHEDGSPMSAQELRDELLTMLVAGHETTAGTLAWTFDRLLGAPSVLGRLVSGVDGGEDEGYLTATIQESMRSRPVLPNVEPRLTMRPIEINGWTYPAGVCLTPNAYLVHHDPEVYPDPYSFRPERFLDTPPGTYTWLPFGGGRRRCIGASFAMVEMKIVLASLLRECEITRAGDGHEPTRRRNITIRPKDGTRVLLRGRVGVWAAVEPGAVAA